MRSARVAPVIAHVGYTRSDEDRERSLIVDAWLERNDGGFFSELLEARELGVSTEVCYDLNSVPPRDFLRTTHTAEIVVLHHLWGLEGSNATSATRRSPLHDAPRWNRRLAATRARYIFVFGADFAVEPAGYACLHEPSLNDLTVWSGSSPPLREPISSAELTVARLKQLHRFTDNQTLDLSHASTISASQLAMIAQMPRLQTLLLQGTSTSDAEFAAMFDAGCRTLRNLYADHTSIADSGLRALSQRRSLTVLSLDHTSVGGALRHLIPLPSLKILSLVNSNIGRADLDALCRLRNLQILNVTGSKLAQGDVEILARELPGCTIDLMDAAAR